MNFGEVVMLYEPALTSIPSPSGEGESERSEDWVRARKSITPLSETRMGISSKGSKAPIVITIMGTPIKAKPAFWLAPLMLWGLLSWLAGPERTWAQRLLIGALAAPLPLIADVGHAVAHIFSARRAGAPMDEILLGPDMPRTCYFDNDVSPQAHRGRALGGPIFSAAGLLLSLLWHFLAAPGTALRFLADVSWISHGFIFAGSLAPIPIVDGGTILKWTLVARGRTPEEADTILRWVGTIVGALLIAGGAVVMALRIWWLAVTLILLGAFGILAAFGKIR
jgi:hypothetical protein